VTDWVRVCRAEVVPEDRPVAARVGGSAVDERTPAGDLVCVARTGDTLHGMLDRCPHREIRLSGGIVRDGLLTCPGHFWRFDLTDGRRTDEPDQVLSLYPTRVTADGWVEVQVPEPEPALSMREWLLAQAREG
jgi:nitrite reductase/ring-hydroxylating ferredoxin subunit